MTDLNLKTVKSAQQFLRRYGSVDINPGTDCLDIFVSHEKGLSITVTIGECDEPLITIADQRTFDPMTLPYQMRGDTQTVVEKWMESCYARA